VTTVLHAGWPDAARSTLENMAKSPAGPRTVHGPGYSGAQGGHPKPVRAERGRFADSFHVYAVEWDADAIRWYVDDTLYKTSPRRTARAMGV